MGNRIIHNPYENGYPRSTGANEILPNDRINVRNKDGEESQTDYAHGYSTVISYTAYLIKNVGTLYPRVPTFTFYSYKYNTL